MRFVLVRFLVCSGLAVSALAQQAPPPAAALAQMREASGGSAWDRVAEIVARGQMIENGFTGNITISIDARSGRNAFRAEFSAVGATIGSGVDSGQSWTLDQNGDLALHPGAKSDADGMTEMYLARRGYWRRDFDGAEVTTGTPVVERGVTYERIEVTPQKARSVTLWINRETHLLDREQWGDTAKIYGDYRKVDGLMLPFLIRYMTGEHENYRYELKTIEARQKLEEEDFDVPFHRDYTMPSSGVATVPSSNGIGFEVRINGKGPFRAFLDTGSMNLISADLAKEIGLTPEGNAKKLASEAGTVDVRQVKVANVEIGEVTLQDQPFQTIAIPPGPGEPLVVLGFEFLQRFVVNVDYERNRLTMYDGARFHYDGVGFEVPMVIGSRNLYVNANVDGFKGTFALDTGNEVAFELEPGFVQKNDFIVRSHARFHGYAGRSYAGLLPQAYYTRIHKLRIGDAEVDEVTANLSEGEPRQGEPDGNIGHSVLRQFNATFDVLRGKLYLEKNANWGPVPFNRVGIVTDPIGGMLKVMTVLPGSSGEKAGLTAGDLITLVNGHIPTDEEDHSTFIQPAGRVVQLMVRHGNSMRMVAVPLRDML